MCVGARRDLDGGSFGSFGRVGLGHRRSLGHFGLVNRGRGRFALLFVLLLLLLGFFFFESGLKQVVFLFGGLGVGTGAPISA